MPWDPILKLYLLNSSSCRSREQCTGPTKKKKGKRAKQCKRVAIQTQPKILFILLRVFDRRDVFFCIKFLLFPAIEF